MAKIRKILGDINSQDCSSLMRIIETQSAATLSTWAIHFAKERYLSIYEAECPGDKRLSDTISHCEEFLMGNKKLSEIKPYIKEAAQIARDAADNPISQAACRAIATACATIQTPTNSLGFVFYGAAAVAYSKVGLNEKPEVYDAFAAVEFRQAFLSLQQIAVKDEPHPAKINWNC